MALCDHDVVLFAPDRARERETGVTDVFDYYGVVPNFSIEYGPWPAFRGRGYWYGWQAARSVCRLDPDLVYGRNLASACFAATMGLPVIFEAHSPIENEGRVARYLFRRLIGSSHFMFLVVITDALRQEYERRWPQLSGRVVVAPDGADPLAPEIRARDLGSSASRLQVGYVGHLYKGKGAETVVELARLCPQFDFHIVGGTASDLCNWQNRTDLPDNLQLHGHQPHGAVQAFLMSFDAVLLPNAPTVKARGGKTDIGQWTSPLKLFEYMAASRAIVCSDVPVLQEIAEDGVNMLVCRHDDLLDWVSALNRLRSDTTLRRALGAEARLQLESRYSWQVRAQGLLDRAEAFGRKTGTEFSR